MLNVQTEVVYTKTWAAAFDVGSFAVLIDTWAFDGLTDGVKIIEPIDALTMRVTRYWLNEAAAQNYFNSIPNLDQCISHGIINQ